MTLTPKGEARREALLDAVLRVLERDGASGVTHRSVAAEAGVPVASATYYFATLDDLFVSALRRATQQQVALFADLGEHDLRGFAEVMHDWAFTHRGAAIAQYELMFLAMRRDALRADAEAWYGALEHAIDPERLHPVRTRVTAHAIDGLLLRMLWLGEPSTVGEIEAAVREITSAISA
ncbi:TetR/AcrR family transcriptional regulator [Salinibacterium soli]|uniref:TetR family transcriptional regulator n=1 Tax=Antiquaquibacter soli TaxID=3064523 RepID=A0ABT9BPY4_9MICO|nr:TetR family transcriptional regulator [Protaetiibacter sp. WY-16]MDO7881470.1 TetR family transcriptional regulator [Protaetiibacter sp. WY-16]